MSENGGSEQSRRYCGNCGAEIRSGTAFCVSCGASLTPGAQEFGPTNLGPTPSEGSSPFDTLLAQLWRAVNRLQEIFSGVNTNDLRRLPGRIVGWFRDLPSVPKLVIIGLVTLVLLTLLSPLAVLVAALVFGVSIIALIIRVVQRGSVRGWGIVAVASLALTFAFGGMSDALYGSGYMRDIAGSATKTDSEARHSGDDRPADGRGGGFPSDQAGLSGPTSRVIEGSIPAGVPSYPVPDYQVIDHYSAGADPETGITTISFQVSAVSLGEADLRGIAEDFAVTMTGNNNAMVLVYDENFEPYDSDFSSGRDPLYSSLDGSTLFPNAVINIDYSRGVYRISYTE